MAQALYFYCLGAAHVDIKIKAYAKHNFSHAQPRAESSTRCLGGVACNVAMNLAYCGADVALASVVGADDDGTMIIEALRRQRVHTRDLIVSNAHPTAHYHAELTPAGELFMAMTSMNIYNELNADHLLNIISHNKLLTDFILDANLPGDSLAAVATYIKKERRLWGVGVSTCKTPVLRRGFPYWHGLIVNRQELVALTGLTELKAGMYALQQKDCSYIIVSDGARGVYYYCKNQEIKHRYPKVSQHITDVSGAGDALSAGVIYSLAHQQSLDEAIDNGLALAQQALLSTNSSLLREKY